MCFYKEKQHKYKKAKRDILVWKKLVKYNANSAYRTTVYNHIYKINELQPHIKIKARYGEIHEGYHFYIEHVSTSELLVDSFNWSNHLKIKNIPFKIPKGTRYIIGYHFGQGIVGVAEQIVRITEKEARTLKELE
jgi:hypothetical protein